MEFRNALKRRISEIEEYETREERANDALQKASTVLEKFNVFKALPKSVQIILWRNGDLQLHKDGKEHDRLLDEFEKLVEADIHLNAMLNDKYVHESESDDDVDVSDVSFDTLRQAYRDLQEIKKQRKHSIKPDLIYEAAIEHLSRDKPFQFPKPNDVDGWKDFLCETD